MQVDNGKRVWSGQYECSLCGLRFVPDSRDPGKLTRDFDDHHRGHDLAASKMTTAN